MGKRSVGARILRIRRYRSLLFTRNSFHDNCSNRVVPRDASYVETKLVCLFTYGCTRSPPPCMYAVFKFAWAHARTGNITFAAEMEQRTREKREDFVGEKHTHIYMTRLHPTGFAVSNLYVRAHSRTFQNSTLWNTVKTLESRRREYSTGIEKPGSDISNNWKPVISRNKFAKIYSKHHSFWKIQQWITCRYTGALKGQWDTEFALSHKWNARKKLNKVNV